MFRYLLQEIEDLLGIFFLFVVEAWPVWLLCLIGTVLLVWIL